MGKNLVLLSDAIKLDKIGQNLILVLKNFLKLQISTVLKVVVVGSELEAS